MENISVWNEWEKLQVDVVEYLNHRYHNDISPVDFSHQDNYLLYCKFSEMLCVKEVCPTCPVQ